MDKILTYIIIIFVFLPISLIYAEDPAHEFSYSELTNIRNPFEPQLPKKIKQAPIERGEITSPQVIESPNTATNQELDTTKFTITGLVWNSDRPQAIINGQVLSVGDDLEGAKIIAISKLGVDVTYNQKTFTIKP